MRSTFAIRKAAFAFLLIRLKAAIQNAVNQSSLSGSLGSSNSPAGVNGTLVTVISGTPMATKCLFIAFLKPKKRLLKTVTSGTSSIFLAGDNGTSFAKVKTTRACSQSFSPKASVSFFIVSKSSVRNRLLVISVQNRNKSKWVTFSLIFRRYSSSLPVASASPGVSNTVIVTPFLTTS